MWSRQDLREKNWKAVEALTTVEKACEEKLLAATKAKVSQVFLFSSGVQSSVSVAGEAFGLPRAASCLLWAACLVLGAVLV